MAEGVLERLIRELIEDEGLDVEDIVERLLNDGFIEVDADFDEDGDLVDEEVVDEDLLGILLGDEVEDSDLETVILEERVEVEEPVDDLVIAEEDGDGEDVDVDEEREVPVEVREEVPVREVEIELVVVRDGKDVTE